MRFGTGFGGEQSLVMRSVRRRSSIGAVLVAVVGTATAFGCSAGLDGTPYHAAQDSTGEPASPSEPKSSPLDAGSHTSHWPAASASSTTNAQGDAQSFVLPDSGITTTPGASDASTTTTPPPATSAPNCSGATGTACEDCCFNSIPGANALDNAIEAEYEDCAYANDCIDQGCFDFCNNQAQNDQCGAQPTLCHLIDNCMNVNRCP